MGFLLVGSGFTVIASQGMSIGETCSALAGIEPAISCILLLSFLVFVHTFSSLTCV